MTARGQARAFGVAFAALAQTKLRQREPATLAALDDVALQLWDAIGEYDFSPYDMGADTSLCVLGLATPHVDPDEPRIEYGPVARPKCGLMRYEITGNSTCMLPRGHDGGCVYEEHDCKDCGHHHGVCRHCGTTHGDTHMTGCKWSGQ